MVFWEYYADYFRAVALSVVDLFTGFIYIQWNLRSECLNSRLLFSTFSISYFMYEKS